MFFALSCSPNGGREALRLESFSQNSKQVVFLNDRLSLRFNASLDPFSISPESVAVAEASTGQKAAGSFRVEGQELQFLPQPVLDPELQGGGFQPGKEYEIRIAGFPRPTALRSADGRMLLEPLRFRFRTVDPSRLPKDFPGPFLDERPQDYLQVLLPGFSQSKVGEPFLLRLSKPIRPETAIPGNFRLVEGSLPSEGPEIPLSARLVENQNEAAIEFRALQDPKAGIWYHLEISERVTDFSGRPVFVLYHSREKTVFPILFSPKS